MQLNDWGPTVPGSATYTTADASAATPAQTAAWYDVMGQLADKEAQFTAAFSDLQSLSDFIATQDPSVQSEYASLVSRAQTLSNTITSVQSAIADVKSALAGAVSYVTGVWGNVSSAVLSAVGLGQLPLIPIAVVAAAVAALGYFLTDYGTFKGKLSLLQQYTAQGATPQQAASAVAQAFGAGSTTSSTIGWVAMLAGGLALLWFLPKMLGQYKALR